MRSVKITTLVKAEPHDLHALFLSMMRRFNAACNWLSGGAFSEKLFPLAPAPTTRPYHELRERFDLRGSEIVRWIVSAAGVPCPVANSSQLESVR